MPLDFNPNQVLRVAEFQTADYTNIQSLARLRREQPMLIDMAVTYAYGTSEDEYGNKSFPFLTETLGAGKRMAITSVSGSFHQMAFGRTVKTAVIGKNQYAPGDKAGLNFQPFAMPFKRGPIKFVKGQMLHGPLPGLVVQVQGAPVAYGTLDVYQVVLGGVNRAAFCPLSALKDGAQWTGGVRKVSQQRSVGVTTSHTQTEYQLKNQLSYIRYSDEVAGNVTNKKLGMKLQIFGKTFITYTELSQYIKEQEFRVAREYDFIDSRYNMLPDGSIPHIDPDTGEPVPMSAGIREQIVHKETYFDLTVKKIDSILTSSFHGATKRSLRLRCGVGFKMKFGEALQKKASSLTLLNADKFVSGTGGNLKLGGYFDTYEHSSGSIVTVELHPSFDHGPEAEASGMNAEHPHLYNHSFDAVCIDETNYDGKANLLYCYEEGRETIEKVMLGMAKYPGYESDFIASDKDSSSWHGFATQAAHLRFPSRCFYLTYTR